MKLTNSPLALVLAQVRIAPVLVLERYVPDIQERLRKSGFPRFARTQVQGFTFGPAGPMVEASTRWEFGDESSNWMIVVTENSVALLTSAHETFESPFLERLMLAVCAVGEFAEPVHVQRAGLRYVNVVTRQGEHGFSEYLHPGFLGPKPDTLGFNDVMSNFVAVGHTTDGVLAVRCNFVSGDTELPPDLNVTNLKLREEIRTPEPHAFLDIDHYSEIDAAFDADAITNCYRRLHVVTRRAFIASTTPFALQTWGHIND